MNADFYKYHALGNDYIVIDPVKTKFNPTHENIKILCRRHTAIGADGIIFGPVDYKKGGDFIAKIFNSDGSETEISGNGIRIFAKYLWQEGYIKEKSFHIKTISGKIAVSILDDKAKYIQADMGTYSFTSTDIPAKGDVREVISEQIVINSKPYSATCVSTGNPHAVVFTDKLSKEELLRIGPALENHYLFPKKINVQFVKVLDKNHLQIKIWERGSGYTLASGSSACAAACAAKQLDLTADKVSVQMPGGIVEIEITSKDHILLTGPVENICSGNFLADLKEKVKF
jgi:diaminopimelate epimerase